MEMKSEKFRSREAAMATLDAALAQGIPVGLQTSVYYLPYLPEAFRFHFNAHNIIVYGKENGEYLVSDPVMEYTTRIAPTDLEAARFARGLPEPRGLMYHVKQQKGAPDFKAAIPKGIKQTCFFMLSPPIPYFGAKAIPLLAKRIEHYPEKLTARKAALYLGNIIRMQEEIGTGGAGFRYLYAAFLQEAAAIMQREDLSRHSETLTGIGDQWRNFAFEAARVVKSRGEGTVSYQALGNLLREIGTREKEFFTILRKLSF